MFNGEFVADDKRANKSITTKNYEFFRSSDLQEWYQSRIANFNIARRILRTR